MRHLLYIVALLAVVMGGCAEKKSSLDAEARDSGRRAAAALVAVDHTDTMLMERAVMFLSQRERPPVVSIHIPRR